MGHLLKNKTEFDWLLIVKHLLLNPLSKKIFAGISAIKKTYNCKCALAKGLVGIIIWFNMLNCSKFIVFNNGRL